MYCTHCVLAAEGANDVASERGNGEEARVHLSGGLQVEPAIITGQTLWINVNNETRVIVV